MKHRWIACVCAALIAGCAAEPVADAPPAGTLVELYVFNTSGWTLIPSNQNVYGNDKLLASLPRLKYTVVRVPSGVYDLRLHGRKLALHATEGNKHFVEVGYRPERWSPTPAQDTVEIRQITEDRARSLMQQLTAQ